MKNILFISLLFISFIAVAQKDNAEFIKAQNQIVTYGDVYFKFTINDMSELDNLPKFISIDNASRKEVNHVFAYVHESRFNDLLALDIPFEVVSKSKSTKALTMATTVAEMANWDRYPTYEVYQQMMQNFATDYPSICQLQSIGTSQGGRDISVLKITDNASLDENEPEFFYTSSMHGDEIVGAVLMLRLIDYLLTNYGSNSQVDNLIDNVEIWINPFANPDGTYHGGNHTVSGATRYLNNGVDANRNFPAPESDHPDGNAWALENIDMMAFADVHNIVLSANLHGGAEVVNYPWDSWYSFERMHADNDWWELVSYEYANTVFANSPFGYFTDVSSDGITFGADWYLIWGGRQDYMTYFKQGREFTLELSSWKMPDAADLPDFWDYNYQSLLLYMDQVLYGIHGIITDSVTGDPIEAKVEIVGHDDDVSFVFSQMPIGNYHRLINQGTYDVTYSKTGYDSQTITTNLSNYNTIVQNVALHPTGASIADELISDAISVVPNPMIDGKTNINFTTSFDKITIDVFDSLGRKIYTDTISNVNNGQQLEINLNNTVESGIYFLSISTPEGIIVKRLIKA